jgi:hypothetical protein
MYLLKMYFSIVNTTMLTSFHLCQDECLKREESFADLSLSALGIEAIFLASNFLTLVSLPLSTNPINSSSFSLYITLFR